MTLFSRYLMRYSISIQARGGSLFSDLDTFTTCYTILCKPHSIPQYNKECSWWWYYFLELMWVMVLIFLYISRYIVIYSAEYELSLSVMWDQYFSMGRYIQDFLMETITYDLSILLMPWVFFLSCLQRKASFQEKKAPEDYITQARQESISSIFATIFYSVIFKDSYQFRFNLAIIIDQIYVGGVECFIWHINIGIIGRIPGNLMCK